ncbi:hypothetical protein [Marisediminicola sp. LYQ134]|uniref:hypothetical protein n=1 Tax=Marisediminicola sp. LYQ134 TaxID=3391061 RepID=UPI003983B7C2
MTPRRIKSLVKNAIRRRLLAGRFRFDRHDFSAVSGREAIVVMCLWNRPSRLEHILRMLDGQEHPEGVVLLLWNNTRADRETYDAAIAAHESRGSLRRVDIVHSPFNLGAIARFYWARRLAVAGYEGPIIVLDDDEDVDSRFVSSALEQYDPLALTSWWAFTVHSVYFDRTAARVGDRVDYAGTGGMVCPATLFRDPRFFTDIPAPFWLLDDMWLNHFALARGLRLAKLDVEIAFVMDETNQAHGQAELKQDFWEYLGGQKRATT